MSASCRPRCFLSSFPFADAGDRHPTENLSENSSENLLEIIGECFLTDINIFFQRREDTQRRIHRRFFFFLTERLINFSQE
jgi:hypothetical protein